MMHFFLTFLLLVSNVHATDRCPDGYTQAPNGGYCYMIKSYYDFLIQQFTPKSYSDVESDCKRSGGFLGSIHSPEENDFVVNLVDAPIPPFDSHCGTWDDYNIGLRCIGKACKWDDGSNVIYTNFQGQVPVDDGKERCYGFEIWKVREATWVEKDCNSKYKGDCWVCSAEPKKLNCIEGETPYKGGCASVYTWPADQKSAETYCPGGGTLVSIHSQSENSFYSELAMSSGLNGTAFIGGQFTNGIFEWVDGSKYDDSLQWSNGFPNTLFGPCVQMMLSSQFGVQGQWTNVDCSVKQPYICFRDGSEINPTSQPLTPKADSQCPLIQYFNGSGSIFSPNYPVSIPSQQKCEYHLEAKEGTRASVIFHTFNCQSGTSLSLYDGLNDDKPFITFTANSPPPNQAYTATSNVLKILFNANENTMGTGWEAEFIGK